MICYYTKNSVKPDFLKNYPLKWHSRGNASIWWHKDFEQPKVKLEQLVPIDDNCGFYKIDNDFDPEKLYKNPLEKIGKPIKLPDNKFYYVPQLRICPNAFSDLPARYFLDHEGERLVVMEQYKEAQNYGNQIMNMMFYKTQPEDFNPFKALSAILGVNYSITEWDVKAFGLFERENFYKVVCNHLLDLDAWYAFENADNQKKS